MTVTSDGRLSGDVTLDLRRAGKVLDRALTRSIGADNCSRVGVAREPDTTFAMLGVRLPCSDRSPIPRACKSSTVDSN